MTAEELGSMLLIAAIIVWVRVATGQWLADILTDHLPELIK